MVLSWPELRVLLAAGGLLGGVVVVEGKVVEGKRGHLGVQGCLSGERCLDCFLDGCRDGTDCLRLWFPALAGFGVVVLLATCATRGTVGGALGCSGFMISPGVGWSCAVSACGGTVSGAPPGVRLRVAPPLSSWYWDFMVPTVDEVPSFPLSWALQNSTS